MRALAIVALVVGSQMVFVRLLTGSWGGTANDPLWVGPLSAGLALLNTVGTLVAAELMAMSWEEAK